ncbi:hypothetical protein PF008_g27486 [Phytophthora fragariae]|uniref:ARS-binding protein 1 N-terminal domain-containing protein n=1 Tax=Phytophthora fragariae TaxID=53985 RepID=A0A6G0QE74_9STRA|nr:hypothetical protein PF008_g27486 [Phytophthora fragariae]
MRPSPQPRTRLTRLQKLTLCQKAHDSPGSSYKQLAEWAQDEFGLAAGARSAASYGPRDYLLCQT